MKQRLLTTICVLMGALLQMQAQALTERYNKQRPAVIISENFQHNEIAEAIAQRLGINCELRKMNEYAANDAFDEGEADVIISTRNADSTECVVSKSILGYTNVNASTVAAIHFVGKDHQLIESFDDVYARLKQEGVIAEILDRWEHPELAEPEEEVAALEVSDVMLILAGILFVASLLILWHIRSTRRHTKEVGEMINQTRLMSKYYEIEDNQAAHELTHKYEAILCNPFVAIAFYDNNGKIVVENEVMKSLGNVHDIPRRQPLYNANGEVSNYIATFIPPTT